MEHRSEPVIECFNPSGFDLPLSEEQIQQLTSSVCSGEEKDFLMIEAVYVDENEIISINQEYLDRSYITDIITFSYNEEDEPLEGTLYMCAPRIAEQAGEFDQMLSKEFARILIHGVLHLCGYDDSDPVSKEHMSTLEDKYLSASGY